MNPDTVQPIRLLVVIACLTAAVPAAGDGNRRSVAVQVGIDWPDQLTTVLAGDVRARSPDKPNATTGRESPGHPDASDAGPGRTMAIHVPGLVPARLVAQQEADSTRCWMIAGLADPQLRGTTATVTSAPLNTTPTVAIVEVDGGWQFADAGRPVLRYTSTPQSHDGRFTRNGFVHPIHSLDGQILTQVFPADHRHHHGLFWAWHQLWVGDQAIGDPWTTDDFLAETRQVRVLDQGPVFATLRARLHWTSPRLVDRSGKRRAIVEETTSIRLFRAAADTQLVDVEVQLTPLLDDVRLGGADNERGYSGFTLRVRPPRSMTIKTDSDTLSDDAVGSHSRWIDVSGQFSAGERRSGIAVLSHPSLAEYPPRWLLRFYGMQNVVYPGRRPIRLSAESPLVLRHRLVIHRSDAAGARIADHQRAYQQTPPFPPREG